nr:hypothetical protein Iba_chr05dCG10930 [Ipomoea batatas]
MASLVVSWCSVSHWPYDASGSALITLKVLEDSTSTTSVQELPKSLLNALNWSKFNAISVGHSHHRPFGDAYELVNPLNVFCLFACGQRVRYNMEWVVEFDLKESVFMREVPGYATSQAAAVGENGERSRQEAAYADMADGLNVRRGRRPMRPILMLQGPCPG